MFMKSIRKEKAFTLIELIVVIAIIAILSAVVVPSLSRFIDDGRYSNDVQVAKSMTSILQGDLVGNPDESYGANDVRDIIDSYHGSEFDFTPESRNTGFFYVESLNEVRALRYEDAESIIEELAELNRSVTPRLLSSSTLSRTGYEHSPEELFGQGGHLLTTEGSAIAMAVNYVRGMAESQSTISNYSEVVSALENIQDNDFIRFFTGNLSSAVLDRAKDMIAYYNPNDTLFVNNSSWATASENEDASKVLFASGISNIPQYNLDDMDFTGNEVVLPQTIRTIAEGAFLNTVFDNETVFTIVGSSSVIAEPNAFSSQLISNVNFNIVVGEIDLVDYSDYISIDLVEDEYTYGFSELPIRDQVTGYSIEMSGSIVTVKIYTSDGLVGYATNLRTVNYYLDSSDAYPYFRVQSASNAFFLPQEPARTGFTFEGWYTDPGTWIDVMLEDDELGQRHVDVYAKWNNE